MAGKLSVAGVVGKHTGVNADFRHRLRPLVIQINAEDKVRVRIDIEPTVALDLSIQLTWPPARIAQRQQALLLYQALSSGKQAIKNGERRARVVEKHMAAIFEAKHQSHIDYLACCDARTLEPLHRIQGKVVLLGAIQIGNIRLIDNLIISIRK